MVSRGENRIRRNREGDGKIMVKRRGSSDGIWEKEENEGDT